MAERRREIWRRGCEIFVLSERMPDLESSHQNTSDCAIFKCMAKSFIFGFIMGSIETFSLFEYQKMIFLAKKCDHLTLEAVGPYNISVSHGSVTDDTP